MVSWPPFPTRAASLGGIVHEETHISFREDGGLTIKNSKFREGERPSGPRKEVGEGEASPALGCYVGLCNWSALATTMAWEPNFVWKIH